MLRQSVVVLDRLTCCDAESGVPSQTPVSLCLGVRSAGCYNLHMNTHTKHSIQIHPRAGVFGKKCADDVKLTLSLYFTRLKKTVGKLHGN